jgi:hypothetical protein
MLRKEDRAHQIECGNEKAFRPTKHVRQPTNSTYTHMQDFVEVKKNFRSTENPREVMIGARNILTNPPKAGTVGRKTTFSGITPYMEDDYMRPKKLATEERVHGQSLM